MQQKNMVQICFSCTHHATDAFIPYQVICKAELFAGNPIEKVTWSTDDRYAYLKTSAGT